MARLDYLNLPFALTPHLEEGETLRYSAFGYFEPTLLARLLIIGVPAGAGMFVIAINAHDYGPETARLTIRIVFGVLGLYVLLITLALRDAFVVGLTDRRLLVLRLKWPLLGRIDVAKGLRAVHKVPLGSEAVTRISSGWYRDLLIVNDGGRLLRVWLPRRYPTANRTNVDELLSVLERVVGVKAA